jgi:hypothetical protein
VGVVRFGEGAGGGGADSMLRFQLMKGGDRMKRC